MLVYGRFFLLGSEFFFRGYVKGAGSDWVVHVVGMVGYGPVNSNSKEPCCLLRMLSLRTRHIERPAGGVRQCASGWVRLPTFEKAGGLELHHGCILVGWGLYVDRTQWERGGVAVRICPVRDRLPMCKQAGGSQAASHRHLGGFEPACGRDLVGEGWRFSVHLVGGCRDMAQRIYQRGVCGLYRGM